MRNFKLTDFYKVAAFMALLIVFSSSCKKDDPILPNYAGTWMASKTISLGDGKSIVQKDIITFTENTFSDLMEETSDQLVSSLILKGSMTINGNIMNCAINQIDISTSIPGMPLGQTVSFHSGSAEFETLLYDTEQSKTFQSEFTILGNQLTLKTDHDKDGVYLGEDEITVYTKQ